MSKFLIAGLGNPGAAYTNTRHNIGFDIADAVAAKHGVRFHTERLADVAVFSYKGKEGILIKPSTYMNLSGRAVRYWMDQRKIGVENLLVLVDEVALPLSKLRLRPAGSAGGHNGLRNIEETLGTDQYPRLRFGIGNDYAKGKQVDYVLGRWTPQELPLVRLKTDYCVEAIENYMFTGIERTMTDINKKDFML